MIEDMLNNVMIIMLKGLDDVNRETWATKIRVFLFSYGFGTVWMQ